MSLQQRLREARGDDTCDRIGGECCGESPFLLLRSIGRRSALELPLRVVAAEQTFLFRGNQGRSPLDLERVSECMTQAFFRIIL